MLATNKTIFTKYAKIIMQWPVYLIIVNFGYKIQRLRIKPRRMIVGLIFIHERNSLKVKIKIYYQTMGVIIKYKSNCYVLYKIIQSNVTALEKNIIKNLLMICIDRNIQ